VPDLLSVNGWYLLQGPAPNKGLELTAYSVRSVRRESGMEECGNTLGVQAPNEPLGLSVIDHSMT
jgi:hypothetical protein